MKKHTFLAFDIGATSGRAVLVILINGKFEMREIHRFPNNLLELHGKYYWNIYNLYEELKKSLSLCTQQHIVPRLDRYRYLGRRFRLSGFRRLFAGVTAGLP